MKRLVNLVAIVISILFLSAVTGLAMEHRYIEDFRTTQYKDTLNTNVHWDTTAGELKLFSFSMNPVGSYDTDGSPFGMALHGDYILVADSYQGLKVIDISNPAAPTLAGSYYTPSAQAVVIVGNYAYLADVSLGLQVIDITSPSSPSLAGSASTSGQSWDVAVMGDSLYLADGTAGLQVFDISNPASPVSTGTYSTSNAHGVAVSGRHLFVADTQEGLLVFDVTGAPAIVGSCGTPGTAVQVHIEGDFAYVADGNSGLQIIDVTDPTLPVPAGGYVTPAKANDVFVTGDWAYVAASLSGVQVFEVSDPTTPLPLSGYITPGYTNTVLVEGDLLFAGDGFAGLAILTAAEAVAPPESTHVYSTVDEARACALSGNHLYVCLNNSSVTRAVEIIDVSDPSDPTQTAVFSTFMNPTEIVVDGNYAYVSELFSGTSAVGGIEIIDISNPANPTQAYLSALGPSAAMAVEGGYLYMTARLFMSETPVFRVFDVSEPESTITLGSYTMASAGYALAAAGNTVYVVDGTLNYRVMDVSDPTSPTLLSSTPSVTIVWDLEVAGDYLFAANSWNGLQIWDISSLPMSNVGSLTGIGEVRYVEVHGDYAIVSAGQRVHVVDVSDPASPVDVGSYIPSQLTGSGTYGVTVGGDHLYACYERDGLHVLRGFWRSFEDWQTQGQSLAVQQVDDSIIRARVSVVQTDSIFWSLSSDSGETWQSVVAGEWSIVSLPPGGLLWRSDHRLVQPNVNPSCSSLDIEWLHEFALIDSIVDVPDDQGGVVRLYFTRSGLDFANAPSYPATAYDVYRRVDQATLQAEVHQASGANGEPRPDDKYRAYVETVQEGSETGVPETVRLGERRFVISEAATGFPPGIWEAVATVHALQQQQYISLVPTLGDSSSSLPCSTYVITTHTTAPSFWYVSAPDSGYSVDNIAPGVPTGFSVAYNTGSGNGLVWEESADEDFQYFRIYRSSDPDFVPSPATLVHSLTGTDWSDPEYEGWDVYYKITALDYAGNESAPASPGTVTAVEEPEIPRAYGLFPNVPNPFNPSTSIRYDVPPGGGEVTLRIYDVSGRFVRTLVDGLQTAGRKTVVWNGRDDRDRSVVSGVYFYRLQAPGYEKTLKMVLIQ
ncbi:MAG: T9SS type A sorting domain-containing protein [Pirellulales bacterium]|nr:T9SS type A sorting domain-containing protein [Pirellulales bacterium]